MIEIFHRVTAIVLDAPPVEGQVAIQGEAGRCCPVSLAPESGDPGKRSALIRLDSESADPGKLTVAVKSAAC
jgi:hypothetical protein